MTPSLPGRQPQIAQIREAALPLVDGESLNPLLARIGDARYVLLGDASHGTAEYYRWREILTRRLIEEKDFSFVAVEGDWPDCHALHCSVTAAPGAPEDPADVLDDFDRWPTWMWANTDVARFSRWLRQHNADLPPHRRVGFFGLDVYSLWESLQAVRHYLAKHHPDAVEHALEAYRCFEPYAEDPQSYALATELVPSGCEPEVLALLVQLRSRAKEAAAADASLDEFAARQNAEVLVGAERYYRAMLHGGPESWNIRDHHMADTLDRLMDYYGPHAKAVVWEHNTHIGDARATDMAAAGMVNVGQLVRERHAADGVVLLGFGSYEGTVIASDRWGGRARAMPVPPAREGSVEDLLHHAMPDGAGLFLFPPAQQVPSAEGRPGWLQEERDHRAIGVVYRPGREKWGNYVATILGERYDAFCFLDRTHALTPLPTGPGDTGEAETWPSGV
ncbi:erythromycin esterase family protein [Streptomyces gobiensis]|uniref:erythromycin esterase family protein n=1 Tax=Streptomyces gobiensis TaxID=2875706 RepID=UPI001E350A0E|nr:erythromycin esterase family protein [Streptomyces gobiensis]UGY93941.1 erythromycin esterase family protein [Streptomyces gobiensis]